MHYPQPAPEGPRPLQIIRLPGEHGPVLRLRGELCQETVEALRRELDLLIPMQHPGLPAFTALIPLSPTSAYAPRRNTGRVAAAA